MTTYAKGVLLSGQEISADALVTKLSATFDLKCTYSPVALGSAAGGDNTEQAANAVNYTGTCGELGSSRCSTLVPKAPT